MRELIDCHMHTSACGHASATVAQLVSAAVFRGITGIILTEHLPLPADMNPEGYLAPDADGFRRFAEEVDVIAGRVKGLEVVLGAEADWIPERPDHMELQRSLAEEAGVAVVLGSVHALNGWTFDDPEHIEEWDNRDVDEVWRAYFSAWCDAARSGRFDVMAHPDLVKKFGHFPSFDTNELYAEAALAARDGGVLVEFSTAGWRKPVGEPYPGPALLHAFRYAGVDVTVGSDAHTTDEVGDRISDAYTVLAEAGFERVVFPKGAGEVRYVEL